MKKNWSKISLQVAPGGVGGQPYKINCYSDGDLSFLNIPMDGLPMRMSPYPERDKLSKNELEELNHIILELLQAKPKSYRHVCDGSFVEIIVSLKDGSIGGIHFYHELISKKLNSLQERLREIMKESYFLNKSESTLRTNRHYHP